MNNPIIIRLILSFEEIELIKKNEFITSYRLCNGDLIYNTNKRKNLKFSNL